MEKVRHGQQLFLGHRLLLCFKGQVEKEKDSIEVFGLKGRRQDEHTVQVVS